MRFTIAPHSENKNLKHNMVANKKIYIENNT